RTIGPMLSGAPQSHAMNAFAFNGAGVLYASNNAQTMPSRTVSLVTINTTTGVVSNIGLLPVNTDAIAFNSFPGCGAGGILAPWRTVANLPVAVQVPAVAGNGVYA